MALRESLNKFHKQQEKCHSTLTSITSRVSSSRAIKHKKDASAGTPPSTPARARSFAVKFSDDTERLKKINNIRGSPAGAQIKHVIDLLLETRHALTPEEIKEACYVDVKAHKAVFHSLRNNLKVSYDGKRFSYKSKHDVKDKDQLISLIRKFPEGIAKVDLKDAYPTVTEDLEVLKATGEVWLLSSLDSKELIAFPNDPKLSITVDDDVKLHFRGIQLPNKMSDIEKELRKNGMEPATNAAEREGPAKVHDMGPSPKPNGKKGKLTKRSKLTNAHLPELFPGLHIPGNKQGNGRR